MAGVSKEVTHYRLVTSIVLHYPGGSGLEEMEIKIYQVVSMDLYSSQLLLLFFYLSHHGQKRQDSSMFFRFIFTTKFDLFMSII